MMFRKDGVEKRLRRIVKGELANLKLLEKQELELEKAVEDNDRLLTSRLEKQSPAEIKIEKEMAKLRERLDKLQADRQQFRESRERSLEPFRQRDEDLREKLKLVRLQLETVRNMRERSFSTSSINLATSPLQISVHQLDLNDGATFSSPATPTNDLYSPHSSAPFSPNSSDPFLHHQSTLV